MSSESACSVAEDVVGLGEGCRGAWRSSSVQSLLAYPEERTPGCRETQRKCVGQLGGSSNPVEMFLLNSQRQGTLLCNDPVLLSMISEFPIML